jgi:hypothetical protein
MPASLKKCLLRQLDQLWGEKGFSRISDKFFGDRYDRAIPAGRQSISLNSHARGEAVVLDPPVVAVRLNDVEDFVFDHEEKSSLLTREAALQRATIGIRLDKGDFLKLLTDKWLITNEDDCVRVTRDYAAEVLREGETFWNSVSNPEDILSILSGPPAKVCLYSGTEYFGAMRAIALAKLLYGDEKARAVARDAVSRLSGSSRAELSRWVDRAYPNPNLS